MVCARLASVALAEKTTETRAIGDSADRSSVISNGIFKFLALGTCTRHVSAAPNTKQRALFRSCVFRSVEARGSHYHGARLRDHGCERDHRQRVRSSEPGEHHGTCAFASSITASTERSREWFAPLVSGPSEREPHLTIPRLPLPRQNLLRAAGLFVGAILFMRNFGEQMAI